MRYQKKNIKRENFSDLSLLLSKFTIFSGDKNCSKKNRQACKRDSVPCPDKYRNLASIIYLGCRSPCNSSSLPTGIGRVALISSRLRRGECAGIFGLATHKVYPSRLSPACRVGSYPTFSPLSRLRRDGYFLWHSLSTL